MIAFAPAKINLGLHVLGRRADGFHDIETVLVPVPWCDAVEVIAGAGQGIALTVSGDAPAVPEEENLCFKACLAFGAKRALPALHMHLHKVIPAGAGLGGGSSDAAAVLRIVNGMLPSPVPEAELEALAAQLGSDCPFFLRGRPCLATGRGEVLETFDPGLRGLHAAIVKPPVAIATGEAYRRVKPRRGRPPLKELLAGPVSEWRRRVVNDFESPAAARFPEIAAIRDRLYALGAVYASLSGSGSAVYGLFERPAALLGEFPGCTTWATPPTAPLA
jgi:4-diphosphocytidyl-2-C-methyl-D-erythritol kinase